MTDQLLIDRKQAAAWAAVSVATWDRMTAAGKTPKPIRLSNGCVRWRTTDLRAWVEAGCPDRFAFESLQAGQT